jgi:predicted hotdog family 3-hydroxylacyl-ACP dehydratase
MQPPALRTGSVLQVYVRQALQGDNGLAAFECRISDANEPPAAMALAVATVTVFQPENVREFLQKISE